MSLLFWETSNHTTLFWTATVFNEKELEVIKTDILKEEKKIIAKFRPVHDGGTGLGLGSLTARFTSFNIWKWKYDWVNKLKTELTRGIEHLDVHDRYEKIYANGWANVMRAGEKIQPHQHHSDPIYLAMHLTIATEDTSTFYKHPEDSECIHEEKNVPGKITVFPGHFVHWTSRYHGSAERISLASDIITGDHFLWQSSNIPNFPFIEIL